jgi:hypothetical protein
LEEAGGKALRCHEMVARRGYRPEMHGVYASRLVPGFFSNLLLLQNITAFLMNQNRQFEDVIRALTYSKDSLDGARYDLPHGQLNTLTTTRVPTTDYEIMTSSHRWMFSPPVPIGVSLP